MRRSLNRILQTLFAAIAVAGVLLSPALAAEKKDFKVAWSIYVGWMPWGYAADSGIVKKWADKYGINIEVKQFNDYVESINQYTAGTYDGCSMTNMDGLSIPSGSGVDTTALIIGDFSNGNDGIVLKGAETLPAIVGQNVNLVELSVSHYLLARALDSVGAAAAHGHGGRDRRRGAVPRLRRLFLHDRRRARHRRRRPRAVAGVRSYIPTFLGGVRSYIATFSPRQATWPFATKMSQCKT